MFVEPLPPDPSPSVLMSSVTVPGEAIRRRYLFSGRVQGVGFRYTVKNVAMRHDVNGFVKNLPDGRVELVMEGSAGEIDGVLRDVRGRMVDYIRAVDSTSAPANGEFEHFSIRY